MTTTPRHSILLLMAVLLPLAGLSQVNSGSDGHDGALNPTSNLVIDMADHPDGIYHYTSVNIPTGVTVSFLPNAANTPVVWLVQGDCIVNGTVSVEAVSSNGVMGTRGGPGGYGGGSGSPGAETSSGAVAGPGGGSRGIHPAPNLNFYGGSASYGTLGAVGGDPSWWGYGQASPESGDAGLHGSPTQYFVLSAILLHELRWRETVEALVGLCMQIPDRFGLKLREEIHAGHMLTRPGELARIPKHERLQILRIVADFLAWIPALNVLSVLVSESGKPVGYDVFDQA